MSESLTEWVSENLDTVKLVARHGRTKTAKAQAKAMLKVAEINLNPEDLEEEKP